MNGRLEQNNNPVETTKEGVRSLFDRLNPRDQLLRLMLVLDVPREKRPDDTLTIAEREEEITNWAATEGPGLAKLSEELKKLIEKQKG
jgi:hypothetical protein